DPLIPDTSAEVRHEPWRQTVEVVQHIDHGAVLLFGEAAADRVDGVAGVRCEAVALIVAVVAFDFCSQPVAEAPTDRGKADEPSAALYLTVKVTQDGHPARRPKERRRDAPTLDVLLLRDVDAHARADVEAGDRLRTRHDRRR